MYYYHNRIEESFFENKRFSDDNLPTNGDLEFLRGTEILKKFGIKLGLGEEKVSKDDWEKLKPILYFTGKGSQIETLRKAAVNNCPKLKEYILSGKIIPFENYQSEDGKNLIKKMKDINVNTFSSMYEYFAEGQHIGNCGITSKLYGIIFEDPEYHTNGQCELLKGTKGCSIENPSHAWLEVILNGEKYIVDTSLLMLIPIELKEKLGYKDLKRPINREELIELEDTDDILYEHYNILSKRSSKNKASFNNYIKVLNRIKDKEQR